MTIEREQGVERTLAQFFFEVGYGACWADGFIKNGSKAPFPLTDAVIDRAWQIAPEAHEDGEEWDRHQALADAAPALLEALKGLLAEFVGPYEESYPSAQAARAAIALASSEGKGEEK